MAHATGHCPASQKRLAEWVPFPVRPKKGKCNATEARHEAAPQLLVIDLW